MNKYNYNIQTFLNNDDVSYYLLGAFITDGCISQDNTHASISSIDEDWLQSIAKFTIENYNELYPIKYYRNIFLLSLNNKTICKWFIDHDCIPAKSLTAKLPFIPEQYLPDFIRGCIDGDGTITNSINTNSYKDKKYISKCINCRLSGSAPDFIFGLHEKLNNLNYKHCLHTRKQNKSIIDGRIIQALNPHHIISFGGNSAFNFLKWIYYPGHKLSMPRKYQLAIDAINFYEEKLKLPHNGKKYFRKITDENIIEIRNLLNNNMPAIKIAHMFNVSQTTIINIKNNKNYPSK